MRIAEPKPCRAVLWTAAFLAFPGAAFASSAAAPAAPPPGVPAAAPPAAEAMGLETRVAVRVKDAPLSTFLDTISAQAKINFILTEGLEKKHVTAFLQNVTVREALQLLLEIKGLSYRQLGHSNTYVVTPREPGAAPAPIPASPHEDPMLVPVTIRVKDAPLSAFFESLSEQSNAGFILDASVEGMRITAFLQNVTVREALEAASDVKRIAYRRIGLTNTYAIETMPAAKKKD